MGDEINIQIEKLILHILDSSVQLPVLSEIIHPADDDIMNFTAGHIQKVLKDEGFRRAYFIGEDNSFKRICMEITKATELFAASTREMADKLYGIMEKYPDIPAADIVCCIFKLDGIRHLGIIKMNYRHSYIHYIENNSSGRVNTIIKQKTTLPGENQKVEECALINLDDFTIKLIEKKYEINGKKDFYFSSLFLESSSQISNNEKIKIFRKATENFNKKYCSDDITKPTDMRKTIADSIERENTIDIENIARSAFRKNPDMIDSYIQHIEKAGLKDKTIGITQQVIEKVFKHHKIKTDTGVELNLPVDFYNDKEKIEFLNNPDGTISIVIKNISRITDI